MPEFILPVRNYRRFEELDAFTQGFIEALFFTESDTAFTMSEWQDSEVQHRLREGQLDGCIPSDCGFDDLHKDSLAAIIADCKAFQAMHAATLAQAYAMQLKQRNGDSELYDEAQAGHDFWLTRNGHGVGFWDRGLGFRRPRQPRKRAVCAC